MEGAGCSAASAGPARTEFVAELVARLVDYRQDSRAGTGARRARAGGGRNRVDLGDLPTAGTGTGARPSAPLPSGGRGHPASGRDKLTGPLEGFDAVLVELDFWPGISAPEHRHPRFILGYVVDGQVRAAINHEADQIVAAGGTFFEPLGAMHTAFGFASKEAQARAVAFMVVPHRQSGVSTQMRSR